MLALINGKVILEDTIENKILIIDNGRIVTIADNLPNGIPTFDCGGLYVSPGFIDIHIHGYNGSDTMDANFEALNNMSLSLIKNGVTAFLPTTMTQTTESTKSAIEAVCKYKNSVEGSQIVGLHMEGPYISHEFKGAQPEEFIANPSTESFKELCGSNKEMVKILTIAPEVKGSEELISYLKKEGITVSVGHTNATYEEAMKGIKSGITHSTHSFNGMKGFTHREPGTLGAVFDSNITAEVICDGIHTHFASIRILLKLKGVENTVLITDCMRAGGLSDGKYELGGQEVFVKNRAARLASGALAGSTLKLNNAVLNAVKELEVTLPEAVRMASMNPAKVGNIKGKGSLKEGYDADIILFDDEINVKKVFIKGSEIL